MCSIQPRQQRRIFGRIPGGELAPSRRLGLDRPPFDPLANQARDLRPAATGHFGQESSHYAPLLAAQFRVPLLLQYPDQQAVQRLPPFDRKTHRPVAFNQCFHLLQRHLLGILHADGHSPEACLISLSPSGSSCTGINLPAQAHVVLETNLLSRLISYWTILLVDINAGHLISLHLNPLSWRPPVSAR